MRLLICLLCALSLSAAGCGDDGGDDLPPDPPPTSTPSDNTAADSGFAKAMISAHNEIRLNATPKPDPALPLLTWSTELAQKALAWAEQCQLGLDPSQVDLGQNITGTTANKVRTAQLVEVAWGSQAASYDYEKNTCAAGKPCIEYKQVVWRATTQVGCAVTLCDVNSPLSNASEWNLWVCFYSPAGNQAGERPY